MARSSITFLFFFIYSTHPCFAIFFDGFVASALLSVTALGLIYVVGISKPYDLIKSLTSSSFVMIWSFYGLLLLISVVKPHSQAEMNKLVYALIFLLSLPTILLLTKSASYERTEQLIKYGLKGVLFGSLLTWIAAVLSYNNLSDVSSRLVIIGSFSPSVLGRSAALIFYASLIFLWRDKKIVHVLFFIISIVLIGLTASKGTIISLALSFMVYLVIRNKVFFAVSVIGLILVLLNIDTSSFQDPQGSLDTFISRAFLWNYIFTTILQSKIDLLLGVGYGASQEMQTADLWSGVEIDQAHNFIVESIMSVGVFGTIFLALLFYKVFASYVNAIKKMERSPILTMFFCLLIFFLFRGLTESSIAQAGSIDVLYYSLIISFIIHYRDNFSPKIKSNFDGINCSLPFP